MYCVCVGVDFCCGIYCVVFILWMVFVFLFGFCVVLVGLLVVVVVVVWRFEV